MKRLGVLPLPPKWDGSPSQGCSPVLNSPVPLSIQMYKWVLRELRVLPENINAGLNLNRSIALTMRPIRSPIIYVSDKTTCLFKLFGDLYQKCVVTKNTYIPLPRMVFGLNLPGYVERNIIETRKWISCADPGPSYVLSTKSESVCLTKAMKRKKKEWKMAEGGQCTFHSIFLKYLYIINCCVLIRSSLWSSLKHGLILQFTHLYILFPLILVPRQTHSPSTYR